MVEAASVTAAFVLTSRCATTGPSDTTDRFGPMPLCVEVAGGSRGRLRGRIVTGTRPAPCAGLVLIVAYGLTRHPSTAALRKRETVARPPKWTHVEQFPQHPATTLGAGPRN